MFLLLEKVLVFPVNFLYMNSLDATHSMNNRDAMPLMVYVATHQML